MENIEIKNVSGKGFETTNLVYEETGEVGFEISSSEFEKHFDLYVREGKVLTRQNSLQKIKFVLKLQLLQLITRSKQKQSGIG